MRAAPRRAARSSADACAPIRQATAHCSRVKTADGALRSHSATAVVGARPCSASRSALLKASSRTRSMPSRGNISVQ